MKKILLFSKRNFIEMVRDPLLYVFCGGLPLFMILMFQVISFYSSSSLPIFKVKSLIPGIMMFSYSLLMLMTSLLVSKDKSSAFLKRLFTSSLKPYHFVFGYFIPFFAIGVVQDVICITLGYICGAMDNTLFATLGEVCLLLIEMIPIKVINIMFGIFVGALLNDKSAPGISSIFVSASGIIGGAWMPVDTMGNFEHIIEWAPFYPSTYLGRVILKAEHTPL
ncbi:MAG: ABC transporter permease [Bacilli bacterium]